MVVNVSEEEKEEMKKSLNILKQTTTELIKQGETEADNLDSSTTVDVLKTATNGAIAKIKGYERFK